MHVNIGPLHFSIGSSQHEPRIELTRQEQDLINEVRDKSLWRDVSPRNKDFSGIRDVVLKKCISIAEENENKTLSIYLSTILESRKDSTFNVVEEPEPLAIEAQVRSHVRPTVGDFLELRLIEIPPHRMDQINALSPSGRKFWRPIGNDSNRYYRSVMFGLFEKIIEGPDRKRRCDFLERLCKDSTSIEPEVKQRFIKGVQSIGGGLACRNVYELERWVHSGHFQDDMIHVSRSLLSDHIRKHIGKNLHGHILTEEDAEKIFIGDSDPKSPIIAHGLLGDALAINLSVISFDPNDENHLKIDSNYYSKNSISVRLLDVPGYYGLLYGVY